MDRKKKTGSSAPKNARKNGRTKIQKLPGDKPTLTIDGVIRFLAEKGIEVTTEELIRVSELKRVPTDYKGLPSDNSRHLKVKMLQSLERSLGVVTTAARLAGIHRSTHYDWLEADTEYADIVKNLEEVALDFSEEALHQRIRAGSDSCIIFHLKTKGKRRGYIETIHNFNENTQNNVHLYLPDNGRDNQTITPHEYVNESLPDFNPGTEESGMRGRA